MGLGLSSCEDDFLDEKHPDKLTGDTFWRNITDAEAGLASAYSQVECATNYWSFAEIKFPIDLFRSDLLGLGTDAAKYSQWVQIYNFDVPADNATITSTWKIYYKGINYANQVMEKVNEIPSDKISYEDKKQIVAEARFLRAYYHLKLLLNWEKIIIKEQAPKTLEDLMQALSERPACWDFIIADFKTASENLKVSHNEENIGRANKGAALGLLGKAYLFRASEDKNVELYILANTAFEALVGLNKYSLVKSFLSVNDGSNQNSTESLFELQLTLNTDNGAYHKFPYNSWLLVSELGGWDEVRGSSTLIEKMKSEGKIANNGLYDTRLYETCFFNDEYFNDDANPRVYGKTYQSIFGSSNKLALRKYISSSADDYNTWESAINIPILRYADILLMYAESLNHVGRTSEAINLINTVRTRADMPAITVSSKADVFSQIQHERIMELTMEGTRFFDMRRWGIAKESLKAVGRTYEDSKAFFPIPETEVFGNTAIE